MGLNSTPNLQFLRNVNQLSTHPAGISACHHSLPSFSEVPAAVEEVLAEFFEGRKRKVAKIGVPVSNAVELLVEYVLGGGKRIRPTYAWAGFVASGGLTNKTEDPGAVLTAIGSLELIQACALIHDDIIDASDTRRGNPTVHRVAERTHAESHRLGDSARFGESIAILVGDLAMVWADDMFHNSGLSDAAIRRASNAWRGMRTEVIGGQLLDIYIESTGSESIELAETVNRFKTAAYTIERPLHIGAALAGADDQTVHCLRNYGRDIGLAFQLRDDLLGVFGDPSVTGKPAGDDLREGKRTVLVAKALEILESAGSIHEAEMIRRDLGAVSGAEDIAQLASIIRSSGAADAVEERIATLRTSGLAHISNDVIDAEAQDFLKHLAIKATSRSF